MATVHFQTIQQFADNCIQQGLKFDKAMFCDIGDGDVEHIARLLDNNVVRKSLMVSYKQNSPSFAWALYCDQNNLTPDVTIKGSFITQLNNDNSSFACKDQLYNFYSVGEELSIPSPVDTLARLEKDVWPHSVFETNGVTPKDVEMFTSWNRLHGDVKYEKGSIKLSTLSSDRVGYLYKYNDSNYMFATNELYKGYLNNQTQANTRFWAKNYFVFELMTDSGDEIFIFDNSGYAMTYPTIAKNMKRYLTLVTNPKFEREEMGQPWIV